VQLNVYKSRQRDVLARAKGFHLERTLFGEFQGLKQMETSTSHISHENPHCAESPPPRYNGAILIEQDKKVIGCMELALVDKRMENPTEYRKGHLNLVIFFACLLNLIKSPRTQVSYGSVDVKRLPAKVPFIISIQIYVALGKRPSSPFQLTPHLLTY
jgi:hypothetical protein